MIPTFAIHSEASRSSSMTTHNASKVPIITKTATPMHTAAAYGLIFSRSKASLLDSASARSSTLIRTIMKMLNNDAVAIIKNGAGSPNGPTTSADSRGPTAKPATSAARRRPRLSPRRSASPSMTIRRIAGNATPRPIPITKRPMSKTTVVCPNASMTKPPKFNRSPTTTIDLACPRSASGARNICARNDDRNPIPTIMPSRLSEMPNRSR